MSKHLCIAFIALAACSSKSKDSAPAGGTATKPVDPPAKPAAPAPAPTPTPAPAPVATGPLTVSSEPGDASCFAYKLARGGAPVTLPKDVATAFACPVMPPTVSPDGRVVVYSAGGGDKLELMYWGEGDPKRLVQFDAGADGVSPPTWSPSGAKLAVVAKGESYPKGTRLFALTVSATGDVTDKVKIDVPVFAPCGSVCTPESVTWKDENSVEVITPADGEPGPKQVVALK